MLQYCHQIHECSAYCLKHSVENGTNVSQCKYGFKQITNKSIIDGMSLSDKPFIEKSKAGFKKLKMKRNHPRLSQTSKHMLQSWRANCDIQLLIYDSHPEAPDYQEIAMVVDYVIGYATKGSHTFTEERNQLRSFVLNSDNNDQNIRRITRQLMNKCGTNRVVSKQECMVLLLDLDLVKCSDQFHDINVSGSSIIRINSSLKRQGIVSRYAQRHGDNDISLHQYFHQSHGQHKGLTKKTWKIPVYIGSTIIPVFPPTFAFARSALFAYKPWRRRFNFDEKNWFQNFESFVNRSDTCPTLKIPYIRAMNRYYTNTINNEPKHTDMQLSATSSENDTDQLHLFGLHFQSNDIDNYNFDYGKTYEWSQRSTYQVCTAF